MIEITTHLEGGEVIDRAEAEDAGGAILAARTLIHEAGSLGYNWNKLRATFVTDGVFVQTAKIQELR
jgi:hypothetical protein